MKMARRAKTVGTACLGDGSAPRQHHGDDPRARFLVELRTTTREREVARRLLGSKCAAWRKENAKSVEGHGESGWARGES